MNNRLIMVTVGLIWLTALIITKDDRILLISQLWLVGSLLVPKD